MKTLLFLTTILSSQVLHASISDDQIRSLARRINLNSQSSERLTADEKIIVLKALNNADSILARVADDRRDPIPPPRDPNWPRPVPQMTCDREIVSNYQAAFEQIKNFAYSSSGLDYTSASATSFADSWTKNNPCYTAPIFVKEATRLLNFAYSTSGLDYTKQASVTFTLDNVDRVCEGARYEEEFTQYYNFAYSRTGLDLSAVEAKKYALDKIQNSGVFSCRKRQ